MPSSVRRQSQCRSDALLRLPACMLSSLPLAADNMALMAPTTTAADVDRHTAVFGECVELLLGRRPSRL